MKVQQMNQPRSRWSARLLNSAMLLILILGVMTPPGARAAQPAATTHPAPAAQVQDLPDWVFQGPAPQLNAQQDTANVPEAQESVSGAVVAIAASPTNPDLVYIGAANGGVWKSINATSATPNWTPLTDPLPSQSIGIGALALDPADATGNTLIAGTGQFSGYANRGDDLAGVYYTTNGGTTWATSTGTDKNLVTYSNNPVKINGVAARGSTLFVTNAFNTGSSGAGAVTTLGGLFRSTNGPTGPWEKLSGSYGLPNAAATFIVGDPKDYNVLYVGFLGASGGIFKTTNLGDSWTNISSGINVISSSTTAFSAAVYNDGTNNVITVLLNGTVNGADGNAIFRSVNGAAFTAFDVPSIFSNAYGVYGLAADKTNPNIVYISGGYVLPGSGPFLASTNRLDASKPSGQQLTLLYGGVSTTLSAAVTNAALSLTVASTSGMPTTYPFNITVDSEQMSVTARTGTTLTVTRGANGTTAAVHSKSAIVAGYPTYGAPHVDVNYLTTDAAGALLMGTHGSLYRLPEPFNPPSVTGPNPNTWASKNGNLGVSEIHDIAYDHVTHTLLAGLQDNCVIYQNAPGSLEWSVGPASGDGGDVAVAELPLPSGTPASTTLLFTQTASWTDLYVASAVGFPAGGFFYVTVDSEQMYVSGVKGAAYAIATATQAGSTVTITTAAPHGLAVGNQVNIRGVSVSGYNSALATITAIPSSTTFTYTVAATGLAAASGGTASNLRLGVTRGVNGTTIATHNAGTAVSSQFLPESVSVRYGSSQTLSSFKRQVFNAANVMLGSTNISTSVITDGQFTNPIAVNAVDPKRLLLGGSANLYESLNMGDTITNIATYGVNSPPGPMVYGGYRNDGPNPDVLYIGSGSSVYTRWTAGSAVTLTAALPAGAGTIRQIAINPADWMNVFAIDSDQVFASTDGGAAWTDITGSLVSSKLSSTEFSGLAFVSGPSPYIAVGTRSGVFASLGSNLGVWAKLGDQLPDVLVFELDYDAVDDVLAAGTLGRAAWLLPDASKAFTPSSVAPTLALSGPTTANEGATQYAYTFTVTDPGDRFTVNGPTITGGTLVAGSLITTGSGGSFKVTFADGPSTATVSLQVTDSTNLASNTASTSVTVANVAPVATILGAPTSGAPGTPINLTGSVTDAGPADTAAGFTYDWLVQKVVGTSTTNFATGSTATFSYTPTVSASYKVYFRAKDKDGQFSSYALKTITAASPDLTLAAVSLTVPEGMAATNSGTFANVNGNPLALTASLGTLTRTDVPPALTMVGYWKLGEDDPGAGATKPGNAITLGRDGSGLNSALDLTRSGNPLYTSLAGSTPSIIYNSNSGSGQFFAGPTVDTVFTISESSMIVKISNRHLNESFPTGQDPTTVDGKISILDYPSGTVRGTWAASITAGITTWQILPNIVLPAGSYQIVESQTGPTSWSYSITSGAPGLQWEANKGMSQVFGSPVPADLNSTLAMRFNGSSYYSLSRPVTTATNNFAIDAWVKPSTATGNQLVFFNGTPTTGGFGLLIMGGEYKWLFNDDGAIADTFVSATPNIWRHVTLVRDSGVLKTYVDGALTNSYNLGMEPAPATTGFVIGGGYPTVDWGNFNGAVDEVRFFTFAPGTFNPQDLTGILKVSGTWEWSYNPEDNAASQDVTITATDTVNNEVTELSFPLTVENVAPTATFTNGGAVNEGSEGTVTFSDPSDPSAADTTAGFHYAYDFDNDGVFETGDGTYAGSVAEASATVPASFLTEGPGTRTVLGRILDKDGGYTDYTTAININNAAPTASVSAPATALVGQVNTILLKATDPSASDQAAGFTYGIDWGDGATETIQPMLGSGDATARHAYAALGNYTIQVTATDKDGAASTPASAAIQVDSLTSSSLQTAIGATPLFFQPVGDTALQSEIAAINGLSTPASPAAITIILGAGPYSAVTLNSPDGITLDLAGNYTASGTPGTTVIQSDSGPAVTVASGNVFVQGNSLATYADAPTVLVTGGQLTLGQSSIQESTNANNVAIKITGGHANLGFDLVTNVNGEGGFVSTYLRSALTPHPEGIDAELSPNTYQVDGTTVHATFLSSTRATSAPASPVSGQAVTFTATIDVNAPEHGPATGTVTFSEGANLLGTGTVNQVGGAFVATFNTSALTPGEHTIQAVYSGDEAYVSSSAVLRVTVVQNQNHAPVAANDAYTTFTNTILNITAPGLLGNDTDADSDSLTAVKVTEPTHGTLTLNANGSFIYTPSAGYSGPDSFTYKVNDGMVDSNVATVTLDIKFGNYLPIVMDDAYTTKANQPLVISAPGVLKNDTDADSDSLTAVKVTSPTHGILTLNANGSFTYTPANNYVGTDSFTYKANDGKGDSNVATVTIAITYKFTGFFQPVDKLPTENTVKAGQSIPVKFSLGGNMGLSIFVPGSPSSKQVSCPGSNTPVDEIGTTSISNSGLTYDTAAGQYTYVWKTEKGWANTCQMLTLTFVDGSKQQALFKFKK